MMGVCPSIIITVVIGVVMSHQKWIVISGLHDQLMLFKIDKNQSHNL
jgi:hypothetical protein